MAAEQATAINTDRDLTDRILKLIYRMTNGADDPQQVRSDVSTRLEAIEQLTRKGKQS